MTTSIFMSYVERMARTRSRRLLNAARATLAPHRDQPWWDTLIEQAYGDGPAPVTTSGPTLFMFNGQPVSPTELKVKLSESLGSGVQVA